MAVVNQQGLEKKVEIELLEDAERIIEHNQAISSGLITQEQPNSSGSRETKNDHCRHRQQLHLQRKTQNQTRRVEREREGENCSHQNKYYFLDTYIVELTE